jgi:hypothetical protein
MNKRVLVLAVCVLSASISGCASLPDAKIRYYLPQTKVSFKVVRTISCDANNYLVISNVATPNVIHSADRKKKHEIQLSALKGTFSDSDVKVDFYEDGRLKDINTSSTGQGESILKTVISIAVAAFGLDSGSKQYPAECAEIKKAGGDKPLTLTYAGDINVNAADAQEIPVEVTSRVYEKRSFWRVIGTVCAVIKAKTVSELPTTYAAQKGEPLLTLNQPAFLQIAVTAGGENGCTSASIWDGEIAVAQLGTQYDLPLPKPALFGKEVLAVTFAESGALTGVQFSSNTGAGQALNVANAALAAEKGETTAQKAADVRAEADLIAQQQRLVQCLADPKNCK